MTELLFIRHGETDWNRQQRFQGQSDVPLNAIGLAQAERLGRRLHDEPHDVLVCSDLIRTRQTAAPLAAAWAKAVVPMSGLREQHFGVLEGLTVPVIQAEHADLWARWLEQDGDFALPGGGESLVQFHRRVIATVRDIAAEHPSRRVTVVTHGGVLDMLWRTARGERIGGLRTCDIPNTGLNRLRWVNGTLEIEQWADAAHLEGLPAQPSTTVVSERG